MSLRRLAAFGQAVSATRHSHLHPGDRVNADSVILELSNPQVEQEMLDAKLLRTAGRTERVRDQYEPA